MTKKKSPIVLLIFLLSFLIGFCAYNSYYYFENIYRFNIGYINKASISKVDNSNVWNTAKKYYTQTLGIDMNTYADIYKTYSLSNYMDRILEPYFRQYGYDCVIASGLRSPHKLANVYAYEKCCEIIGETKINKDGILKYLKAMKIDERNYSETEEEQDYLTLAKSRYNLAVSLLSGSCSSEMISRNSTSTAYCWAANCLNHKTRLRMYNKSGYLTAKNHYIDTDSKIEFISKDVIKIESSSPYAVYIGNDEIVMYDINTQIENKVFQNEKKRVFTMDLMYTGHSVSGKYSFEEYREYSNMPVYEFTLNLDTGELEIKDAKEM